MSPAEGDTGVEVVAGSDVVSMKVMGGSADAAAVAVSFLDCLGPAVVGDKVTARSATVGVRGLMCRTSTSVGRKPWAANDRADTHRSLRPRCVDRMTARADCVPCTVSHYLAVSNLLVDQPADRAGAFLAFDLKRARFGLSFEAHRCFLHPARRQVRQPRDPFDVL